MIGINYEEKKYTYPLHNILVWPFQFEMSDWMMIQKSRDRFVKHLDKNLWSLVKPLSSVETNHIDDSFISRANDYMLRNYLTQPALDVFNTLSTQERIKDEEYPCCIYERTDILKDHKPNYCYKLTLQKKAEDRSGTDEEYVFPIVSLKLHLYDYGVGLLFMEVVGGVSDYKNPSSKCIEIADILKCNDLMRRWILPFTSKDDTIITASMISITEFETGADISKYDFLEDNKSVQMANYSDVRKRLNGINQFTLAALLGWKYRDCKEKKNEFENISLHSYKDERTFLISLIRNSELSDKIADYYDDSKAGLQDTSNNHLVLVGKHQRMELMELLYAIAYVDQTHITCQNNEMKEKLLSEAIYDRWSGYGTIHAITKYSMICVTTEKQLVNDTVVRPFLEEYVYLFAIAFAQKKILEKFSEEMGKLAGKLRASRIIYPNTKFKLSSIQKKYVLFQNTLMLKDVTLQDQGIDMYDQMKEQFGIADMFESLTKQMEGMFALVDASNAFSLQIVGFIIALVSVPQFLQLVSYLWNLSLCRYIIAGMVLLLILGSVLKRFRKRFRNFHS